MRTSSNTTVTSTSWFYISVFESRCHQVPQRCLHWGVLTVLVPSMWRSGLQTVSETAGRDFKCWKTRWIWYVSPRHLKFREAGRSPSNWGKGGGGPKDGKTTQVLRKEFSTLENLSGTCSSIFSLFRRSQLNSCKTITTNDRYGIWFPDFLPFPYSTTFLCREPSGTTLQGYLARPDNPSNV